MKFLTAYQQLLDASLISANKDKAPQGLYAPIDYLLSLGGKRLRPILVLMACEAFGRDAKAGLATAKAVEIFHNFTLMHDDIMDKATLRRGQQTVHQKWDVNTAILSGDAMLIQAYECFSSYPPEQFKELTQLLSKTALEVCEGQQYDVDFEKQNETTIEAYLEMIRLKTAVLVGCALQMGAYIANSNEEEAQKIYDFGVLLGLAFQIQDDYLDAFGDPKTFGKQIGGDIIENKKTILYHKALLLGNEDQKTQLRSWFESSEDFVVEQKIKAVKELFVQTTAEEASQELMQKYTEQAYKALESLDIKQQGEAILRSFASQLMQRRF